ncbi:hypothetical protein ANMWB30_24370 [Arthrobacter sp. MWB30]|nr:hypothetical protein ANMWB30_24370 [Arthrobacter sp. MWB30]
MTLTLVTLVVDNDTPGNIAGPIPGSRILSVAHLEACTLLHVPVKHSINGLTNTVNDGATALDPAKAEELMDGDGVVTVVLLLDRDNFMEHVIASATTGKSTPESYAHSAAFTFGSPDEASAEIIGVAGTDFIVSYTTHIREFLDG